MTAEVTSVARQLCNNAPRPNRSGLFAGEAALVRLRASFRSVEYVLRERYAFETAVLCRFILEQIAWAYAVRELNGAAVFKVSATKAVGKLKDILPQAGPLYGVLSTYAHIDPQITNEYIDVWGDGAPDVLLRDPLRTRYMALFVAVLTDFYRVAAEAISFEYFAQPLAWKRIDNDLHLLNERPLTVTIEAYRDQLREHYGDNLA